MYRNMPTKLIDCQNSDSSSMIYKMENQPKYEVMIDKLAYGGDGFARLADGRAVFIPDVIPGEKVSIRIVEDKQKYARAAALEVLTASQVRIKPPCPHFGVCGGCQYQHIQYEAQVQLKKEILKDQLTRIGHLDSVAEIEVFSSDLPFGYRNVMQFHPLPDGKLGLMKRNSQAVFELTRCLLPMPAIAQFWQYLTLEADSGITRIEVRQNREEDLLVLLQGEGAELPEIAVDMPISMVHRVGNDTVVLSGDDAIVMTILDIPFHLSAGAFFQVNDCITEKMVQRLLDILARKKPRRVLDLYSGAGLFSRFMAPEVQQVTAIESNALACHDFVINLDDFDNVTLYEGLAEQVLPSLDIEADLVVCDPPRAGLHVKVIDTLAESGIPTLVYISCDPATLARDIRRLVEKGFIVENIAMFDMFPQTYHFESMVVLARL
ncbi:MAG TPA: hypothetical protein DCK95_10045 [Anaerolineaceae bacterium]|nr:hypothetical protein [Anaerolineaceae bacterium]